MPSVPICTSDEEMIRWLLDHGADPNSRCNWDFTPASLAMYTASIDTIDYLFQRGADTLYGELLQWAVIRNEPNALDVVRQVVEKGAPIDEIKYANDLKSYNQRKPFGLGTPLHRAAEDGKVDIVKYLLEMGADPLKLDSKGRTPRFWAEKNGGAADVVLILKEAENRHA
jgi:ankyrin repeat protein